MADESTYRLPEWSEGLRREEDPYGEYPRTFMTPLAGAVVKLLRGYAAMPEKAWRAANPPYISDDPHEQSRAMGDAALSVGMMAGGRSVPKGEVTFGSGPTFPRGPKGPPDADVIPFPSDRVKPSSGAPGPAHIVDIPLAESRAHVPVKGLSESEDFLPDNEYDLASHPTSPETSQALRDFQERMNTKYRPMWSFKDLSPAEATELMGLSRAHATGLEADTSSFRPNDPKDLDTSFQKPNPALQQDMWRLLQAYKGEPPGILTHEVPKKGDDGMMKTGEPRKMPAPAPRTPQEDEMDAFDQHLTTKYGDNWDPRDLSPEDATRWNGLSRAWMQSQGMAESGYQSPRPITEPHTATTQPNDTLADHMRRILEAFGKNPEGNKPR